MRLSDVTVGGAAGDVEVRVHVPQGGGTGIVGQYVTFTELFDEVRLDGRVPPECKPAEPEESREIIASLAQAS